MAAASAITFRFRASLIALPNSTTSPASPASSRRRAVGGSVVIHVLSSLGHGLAFRYQICAKSFSSSVASHLPYRANPTATRHSRGSAPPTFVVRLRRSNSLAFHRAPGLAQDLGTLCLKKPLESHWYTRHDQRVSP